MVGRGKQSLRAEVGDRAPRTQDSWSEVPQRPWGYTNRRVGHQGTVTGIGVVLP